jgi:hypothetical protein
MFDAAEAAFDILVNNAGIMTLSTPGPTATNLFLNGKSPELIDRPAKLAPLPGSTARHCGSMAALSKNHIPSEFGT